MFRRFGRFAGIDDQGNHIRLTYQEGYVVVIEPAAMKADGLPFKDGFSMLCYLEMIADLDRGAL